MCSSHQKKHSDNENNKLECPSCGEIEMVLKHGNTLMDDGMVIKNITYWYCQKCGEELFDMHNIKKIRLQQKQNSVLV